MGKSLTRQEPTGSRDGASDYYVAPRRKVLGEVPTAYGSQSEVAAYAATSPHLPSLAAERHGYLSHWASCPPVLGTVPQKYYD